MEANEHIEQLLNLDRQLTAIEKKDREDELIFYINYLLLHDFSKLVHILYRIDINEERLKELLKKTPGTDSARIIADLLMQRQGEKDKIKSSFKPNEDIPEEDKW